MIVDGKEIRDQIKEKLAREVRARKVSPELCIFVVGHNPVTDSFVKVKRTFAKDIGVTLHERRFRSDVSEDEIIKSIEVDAGKENRGIIIQLPLSKHLNAQNVLDAVPITHDVDVLSTKATQAFNEDILPILPPVVGAMKEILERTGVFIGNKKVVIVGRKKLVGAPATVWFRRHESNVVVLGRDTIDISLHTIDADIIVLGAGSPGLLKPEMIKAGVVILDAGTSESHGKIAGDADSSCAEKASIYTPVPGGIGPITVAVLFKNLLELTKQPD